MLLTCLLRNFHSNAPQYRSYFMYTGKRIYIVIQESFCCLYFKGLSAQIRKCVQLIENTFEYLGTLVHN